MLITVKRALHCSKSLSRKHYAIMNWAQNNECLAQLEQLGLTIREVLGSKDLLSEEFTSLKNNAQILEESGIALTVENLKRFKTLYHSDVESLYEDNLVTSLNVTERYLQYLDDFPFKPDLVMPTTASVADFYHPIQQYHRKSLQDKQIIADWPKNMTLEQNRTLLNEQRRVVRQYYVWRLASDYYTIDKRMYHYAKVSSPMSLRNIKQTLDILENELELPKSKIVRNFYLMCLVPERLIDLTKNVSEIGDFELKQAAAIAPKLLAKTSAQILEIEQLFKSYEIGGGSSPYRVQLLTYQVGTLSRRLQQIAQSDMATFLDHPRFCELLFFFTKSWRRMEQVRSMGFKCISLNLLTCSQAIFESFLSDGVDRRYTMRDINTYIAQRLSAPRQLVVLFMEKHPLRHFVPLEEIKSTLELLLDLGYPKPVILDAVQILLYPRDKVLEAVNQIISNKQLSSYGFHAGFTPSYKSNFPTGSQYEDKRLLLALYYMEKPYHFTGEGAMRANNGNACDKDLPYSL